MKTNSLLTVELKQKPSGIRRAKALVIFLDPEEAQERHAVDLGMARKGKNIVLDAGHEKVEKTIWATMGAITGMSYSGSMMLLHDRK